MDSNRMEYDSIEKMDSDRLTKLRTKLCENPTGDARFQAVGGVGMAGTAMGLQSHSITMTISYWSVVALQAAGVNGFSQTLCKYGAGNLVTLVLWLAGLVLLVKAVAAGYRGISAGRGRSASSSVDRQEHHQNAAVLGLGAFACGISPALLRASGFSLLPCIKSVPIYGNQAGAMIVNPATVMHMSSVVATLL